MNKYIDTIKLNCEQYIKKYPGNGKLYDTINTMLWTWIGMVAGYIMGATI